MPALRALAREGALARPLEGWAVLLNMHLTRETVALAAALAACGAAVLYHPSGAAPPSAGVAALARRHGVLLEGPGALAAAPAARSGMLVVEGNGRFFRLLHEGEPAGPLAAVRGISMHTSGGGRLVDAFDPARLRVPVTAVYRDPLKTALETGLGTSQSVAAALLAGMGRPVAGAVCVVVGYGHVGRGVARVLGALGARVQVAEARADARLEAGLHGLEVVELAEALPGADLCVTTTGTARVVHAGLLRRLRRPLVLANVSNRPDEIDLDGARPLGDAESPVARWAAADGSSFVLLGGGVQVNHVLAEGNPQELMDLSFALHVAALRWMAERAPGPGVYALPDALRQRVAVLHAGAMA